jgi:hypothetical protein
MFIAVEPLERRRELCTMTVHYARTFTMSDTATRFSTQG